MGECWVYCWQILICFSSFEGSQTNLYQSLDETAVMLLVVRRASTYCRSDKQTPLSQFSSAYLVRGNAGSNSKTQWNEQGQMVIAVYRHLHLGASMDFSLICYSDTNVRMPKGNLNQVIVWICGVLMLMAIVLFAARRLTRAENNIRQSIRILKQRVIVRY